MSNEKSFLIICLLMHVVINAQASADHITIKYADSDHSLVVTHCFQSAPDYVEANSRLLQPATSNIQWNNQQAQVYRGYVELPDGESGCLSYVVNGKGITSKQLQSQLTNQLLFKIDSMIWQPNDTPNRASSDVVINHAGGILTSAPWRLINRSEKQTVYHTKPSPKYAAGYLAIGKLKTQEISLGSARLRLAIMAGKFEQKSKQIEHWIKTMANSVAQIGNGFPLSDVQILVVVVDGQGGVVPWGQVNRAGGQGVLFVVNGNKSQAELMSDWTAAHEFSHLLTPYTPDDRWLSEGFASYHQNISRLKNGLLDEKTAWSKLIAGFERGYKSASKSTAPVLKHADRYHNMQMYWGGAVFALKAEVALQLETQGKMTLSDALAGLQGCCLGQGKGWTAGDLFSELDLITGTQVFSKLYEREALKKSFPSYHDLLQQLGVKKSPSGSLSFDDSAPLAAVRNRIAEKS